MSMRRQAGAAVAVVVVAVVSLAGCGGSKPSALEQWQGSVCSTLNDYVDEMSGYAGDVRAQIASPHAGMMNEIRATVDQGKAATDSLGTQLRALDAPPVDNGQTVKELVDGLSADLQQSGTRIQQEVDSIGTGGVTEAASSVASIAREISGGVDKVQGTVESLQSMNAELKAGFENVDSCKELRGRFSE